jgi:hypothetical protein
MTNLNDKIKKSLKKNLDNHLFDQIHGGVNLNVQYKTTWDINFKMNRVLIRQIDDRIRRQLYNFI